jgi:hypothetical protein
MHGIVWSALLLAMVTGACSEGTIAAPEPPAEDVVLRVVVGGEVVTDDVLDASGVGKWESGEVRGMGEGRVFEVGLDISFAEVDEGWIMDVTKQGTLKLASAALPRDQWVRDVGEISIP